MRNKLRKLFSTEIYHFHVFKCKTESFKNRLQDYSNVVEEKFLILQNENQIELAYELAQTWPKEYYSLGSVANQYHNILQRITNGNICFILKINDEISHFQWLCVKNTNYVYSYMKSIELNSDEAVVYNIYTYPKFRGKKLFNYISFKMAEFLYRNGYNYLIAYVGYMNMKSLVFHRKYSDFYAVLYYLRISYLKKYILKKIEN